MNPRFPGIIGHDEALSRIPAVLPPVLLLRGPEGVGKFRIALMLACEVTPAVLDRQVIGRLTRAAVDSVLAFHAAYPLISEHKVSVINLDHAAINGLMMSLLEDPPSYSRLILHTSESMPLAVQSRAQTIQFGTLSVPEVSLILEQRGTPSAEAASASTGSVARALAYLEHQSIREDVERLLEALKARDKVLTHVLAERALEASPEIACAWLSRRLSMTGSPAPTVQAALDLLGSNARPVLRFRGAVRTLAAGV